jgi:hypothetical protein
MDRIPERKHSRAWNHTCFQMDAYLVPLLPIVLVEPCLYSSLIKAYSISRKSHNSLDFEDLLTGHPLLQPDRQYNHV